MMYQYFSSPERNRNCAIRPSRIKLNGIPTKIEVRSSAMDNQNTANTDLVKNSVLYREFLAEREEILKHKWIESEKVGHDIGFEKALLDWIIKHRSEWRSDRHKPAQQKGIPNS
jgi:hypothetical protein